MNKTLREALLKKELKIRDEVKPPNVLGECFAQQLDFINSSAKKKVLCLTRRAGKSYCVAVYLINEALLNPKSKLIYIHLTKKEAIDTMWLDIFETIILKLEIKAELVGQQIRFDNGSIIYLTGIDATPKEKEKLRGKKYRLAVIDECQSFRQDLKNTIHSVLGPTLADNNATLCLCGTAGNQMGEHYWYQINRPDSEEKGWTFFKWTWEDNVFKRDNIRAYLNDLKASDPGIVKTNSFRQEWLGEWVPETDARVYRSEKPNYVEELPPGFLVGASYILSIDLGYYDATAFVVSAYNKKFDNTLYILESQKKSELLPSAVTAMIKEYYMQKYKFRSMYVDAGGGALQFVEEMRQIHQLPLQSAQKLGKEAHISLLNDDFITGKVKILKPNNEALIKELDTLIWDVKVLKETGQRKEDASKQNHLCFIAGTKVQTINGPKNIEDIKVGELILTRKGYLPAIWSGQTGIEEIYHLKTKYGRELYATKTHPIFIKDKLVPLSELRCGDILTCIEEHLCQNQKIINSDQVLKLNSKELFIEDIQKQNVDQIASISLPPATCYTEQFGQTLTSKKYLKDMTFTILTKIRSIIPLIIYNFLRKKSIVNYMEMLIGEIQNVELKLQQLWKKLEKQPNFGMVLQKVWNGIVNMLKNSGLLWNLNNLFAKYVTNNLNPNYQMLRCVQTNAMLNSVESLELMMNPEFAQPVIIVSKPINMEKLNTVPDYVSTVETTNIVAPVYNITVQDQHEYFANGILVSNTDACLYGHHNARHYWYKAPVLESSYNTKEEAVDDKVQQEILKQYGAKKKKNLDYSIWEKMNGNYS